MLRTLLLLTAVFISPVVFSQTIYKSFTSANFKEERQLKIQLPRNYHSNTHKKYPVAIVLDGDYLFEPLAGIIDYYSYWDEIPETIVVGINQSESRENDSYYDDSRHLPFGTGAAFYEFIGMEVLPYITRTYRTTHFATIVGHDLTANFANYFLFKSQPLFRAYVNLSPDLAPQMANRLRGTFNRLDTKTWYYLATGSEDIPDLRTGALDLDQELSAIENPNFGYGFDDFSDSNHYTFIGQALPKAMETVFKSYRPITNKEYEENILTADSPFQYLSDKYETIQKSFGIEIPVRINDFLAVGKALEVTEKWEELELLGKMASEQRPAYILGAYFSGRAYEALGDSERAIKTYRSSWDKEEIAFMTVDYLLQRAENIERGQASPLSQ